MLRGSQSLYCHKEHALRWKKGKQPWMGLAERGQLGQERKNKKSRTYDISVNKRKCRHRTYHGQSPKAIKYTILCLR